MPRLLEAIALAHNTFSCLPVHPPNAQVAKLQAVRSSRDDAAAKAALEALTTCARAEGAAKDNLLHLAINAARCRCSVGEISDALEAVWGRAQILSETITGA